MRTSRRLPPTASDCLRDAVGVAPSPPPPTASHRSLYGSGRRWWDAVDRGVGGLDGAGDPGGRPSCRKMKSTSVTVVTSGSPSETPETNGIA